MATVPTVGRKMYYCTNGYGNFVSLDDQPLDATVIWVDPSDTNSVHLQVIDHAGNVYYMPDTPVKQPEDDEIPNCCYAEWMPYQVAQAKKDVTV